MRHLRVLSGAAAICAAFFVQSSSQAGFGHFGGMGSMGGYGSSGLGYGSYGSSGYDAGYGSSGGVAVAAYGSSGGGSAGFGSSGGVGHVGPLKRLAARIHAHHAAKVAARSSFYGGSSGGGYGSTGLSYGSSGGALVYQSAYGSSGSTAVYGGGSSGGAAYPAYSGGSAGSSYETPMYDSSYAPSDMYTPMTNETILNDGYDSGSVAEPTPAESTPATPTPTPTPDAEASLEKDAALLTIAVPESATVVVNGLETTSVGEIRQFMSNGLKDGYVYTYVVAVSYEGSTESETKTIKLRAGQAERLVFDAPKISKAKPSALETVVVLRVPADAKVNLAGNPTNGSGELRTFRTRQLAEGQTWENYTIEVTAEINGQPVTKEKTLSLVAGTSHDFSFDFGNTSIASR